MLARGLGFDVFRAWPSSGRHQIWFHTCRESLRAWPSSGRNHILFPCLQGSSVLMFSEPGHLRVGTKFGSHACMETRFCCFKNLALPGYEPNLVPMPARELGVNVLRAWPSLGRNQIWFSCLQGGSQSLALSGLAGTKFGSHASGGSVLMFSEPGPPR